MKLRIYTIHDCKSESYAQPFTQMTDGQATRTFSDMCNEPNHPIGNHSEDYTLFMIGEFDDQTGEITAIPAISIGNGVNFKTPTEFPTLDRE